MVKDFPTPLHKLIEIEHDARGFGFDWPDKEMIIEQAISECEEIKEAIIRGESNERIQEEIGDLLHAAISLCIFAGFDVEETISKINKKFGKRIIDLKDIAQKYDLQNLHGQSIDFMLKLWHEVKKNEQIIKG